MKYHWESRFITIEKKAIRLFCELCILIICILIQPTTAKDIIKGPPQPKAPTNRASSSPINIETKTTITGNAVLLSWSPVTQDTSGQPETIACYEIYRDTLPYFHPSLSNKLAETTSTGYVDTKPGLLGDPAVNHYYAITARDDKGNISRPSYQVCEYDVVLPQGWCIFSLPVEPSSTDLSQILRDQLTGAATEGESDLVYFYDPITKTFIKAWYNSATGEWQGELDSLKHNSGYLIYVRPDHPAPIISLLGTLTSQSQQLQIYEGWNLIGSPYCQARNLNNVGLIESGFSGASNPLESDRIYSYTSQSYKNTWYHSEEEGWYGDITEMQPGQGFWLLRVPGRSDFIWRIPKP